MERIGKNDQHYSLLRNYVGIFHYPFDFIISFLIILGIIALKCNNFCVEFSTKRQ